MPIDINKMQVDIENLFKQNVNDLTSIKELYRKLKEMDEKISQIKYINNILADKLKKEHESLKDLIQSGGNQSGGNQSGGNQSDGNQSGGNQSDLYNKINEINRNLDAIIANTYNKTEVDYIISSIVLESENIPLIKVTDKETFKIVNVVSNVPSEPNEPSESISVQSVTLNKSTCKLKIDETLQLTPVITPSNATNKEVIWETSNSNCSVVNGLVTAKVEGECIITCKTVDGNKTDSCTITIEAKENEDENIPTFTNYIYNTETFNNPASGLVPLASTYYQTTGYTKTVSNGVLKATLNTTTYGNAAFMHKFCYKDNSINGTDIWYYQVKLKIGLANARIVLLNNQILNENITKGEWITVSVRFTNETSNTQKLMIGYIDNSNLGETIELKEPMLINLTEVYGSGKEPEKEICDSTFNTFKSGLIG